MEKLPTEVALDVLRHLKKPDLKTLRIVNKRLCDLCSPFLFHRVFTSIHRKDMEAFTHIASHPVLRLLVTEVVYNGVYFKRCVFEETSCEASTANCEYYRQRHSEQKAALKSKFIIGEITEALKAMPNVQRVTLTNRWRRMRDRLGNGTSRERQVGLCIWGGPRGAGPLSRDYPDDLQKPLGWSFRFDGQDSGHLNVPVDYGFRLMCRAVSAAGRQIQELVIDYGPPAEPHEHNTLLGISTNSLNVRRQVFKQYRDVFLHLSRIYFSLDIYRNGHEDQYALRGRLAKLLGSAHDLEELSFDFNSPWRGVPLKTCFGSHHWPRLRLLSLFRNMGTEEELSEFIGRHRESLRVLKIEDYALRKGDVSEDGASWKEAAKKWHDWLFLEDLRCRGLLEMSAEGRVCRINMRKLIKRYVKHGKWH